MTPSVVKYGTPWNDVELDAIVADYFAMLADELAEKPYVKSHHSAALMARIGRSHRSVEFKHQNISAVLEVLGLPWIPGYRPKANYQNAIFDAIDRYLSREKAILELAPAVSIPIDPASAVFVPPPLPAINDSPRPLRLERLVRKFDPVQRDHNNRRLGKAGEAFVVELEKLRLAEARRDDLADRVRWVADLDGDGAGFDVLSYEVTGKQRLIEVKTTNGAAKTPFFLTRTELEVAAERQADWQLYRVHLFAKTPRIFAMLPPLESAAILRPEVWRASFQ